MELIDPNGPRRKFSLLAPGEIAPQTGPRTFMGYDTNDILYTYLYNLTLDQIDDTTKTHTYYLTYKSEQANLFTLLHLNEKLGRNGKPLSQKSKS